MNPRSTLGIAVLAAALGAFIWFYEIEGEEGRARAEQAQKELFADLEAEEIDWIELETSDGVQARIERRDARWQLVSPVDFPADTVTLDSMASALADLAHEQTIEAGQRLELYGLGDGSRRIGLGAGSRELSLRIGDQAPVGSSSYVARGADEAVFTTLSWRLNAFSEPLLDLRDRRVLAFDATAVRRIEVSWPAGGVSLERTPETWQIVAPLVTDADDERIDALLSDLSYLRTDGFVDEPLTAAAAGLDEPAFAVTLVLEAAADEEDMRTLRFELGRERADGMRLARGSHATLYAIDADRINDFPRELVEYRDRELSRLVNSEVDSLELMFSRAGDGDGAGGSTVLVAVKRDEGSWLSEPPLRDGVASDIVANLANLRASEIVAESVGEEERVGLGLSPPTVRIRALGRPTGEDEVAPVLADVMLGHFDAQRGILAMKSGRSEVFRLPARLAENLPVDHDAFEARFTAPEPVDPQASD